MAPIADLLFDAPEDRRSAELALEALAAVPCPTAARILAHSVAEPVLEEELEERAFGVLKRLWPLPRRYMLYALQKHEHEDLPFRWFELLIDVNEISTTDRAIEELVKQRWLLPEDRVAFLMLGEREWAEATRQP